MRIKTWPYNVRLRYMVVDDTPADFGEPIVISYHVDLQSAKAMLQYYKGYFGDSYRAQYMKIMTSPYDVPYRAQHMKTMESPKGKRQYKKKSRSSVPSKGEKVPIDSPPNSH